MSEYIFLLAFFLLIYTWIGYYGILSLLATFFPNKGLRFGKAEFKPFISILVSAYNEADVIEQRIINLLSLRYPKDLMEIMIGSDGSTDKTTKIAKKYVGKGVVVAEFKRNRGRADVHNDLIRVAKGEIVVFTDADTEFDILFLEKIVEPFANPEIGSVIGHLNYRIKGGPIGVNEGLYWKYELKIKELENKIGILNNGIGAAMAIRKKLFKELAPVDDVDTATVIDILFQGYKIFYQQNALSYDTPPHNPKGEFKMRVRGTSKTLRSLARRSGLRGWLRNPAICWGILSHRVLRYATPFLMVTLLVSNLFLLKSHFLYQLIFLFQIIFYLAAMFGGIGNRINKNFSVASSVFSFCIAMFGMMIGVFMAITGNVKVTYKTDDG